MNQTASGALAKLSSQLFKNGDIEYALPVGQERIALNQLLGKTLTINFDGDIKCSHCGQATKKSYSQGFCYPCTQRLAQCDMCVMKPETCHFDQGTCREPTWGERNCMIGHYVYLANTSGVKVGITRHTQIPTRWVDQGASQALPIFYVKSRLISGLVEVALADFINDKTNWRAMLKEPAAAIDLKQQAQQLMPMIEEKLVDIKAKYGENCIEALDEDVVELTYPIEQYPEKITSLNLDKTPTISGVIQGIKGQYLLLDTGVINIRKYGAYQVSVEIS